MPPSAIALAVPPLDTSDQPSSFRDRANVDDPGLVVHGQQRGGHGPIVGMREPGSEPPAGDMSVERPRRGYGRACPVSSEDRGRPQEGKKMDFSKFKTSDWLIVGGGGAMFIGGFLNWITISGFGFSDSGGNAFDFFFTGTVPWLLLVASAVITALVVTGTLKKEQAPWTMIILAATALSALLLIIRFIFNPIEGKDIIESAGGSVGRGIGMIVSLIGGLVATAGAFMNFQAAGGELSDLTDMNKLKESFGGDKSDDAPPPPPAP